MTLLSDVVDLTAVDAAIARGLVVARDHATEPLRILNYTSRCQYERGLWSPVTMACRGLIYHRETLEVRARPFRKFFNYGQSEAPVLDMGARAVVTDKLDGSLGILYRREVGFAIATRGAFESEQAQHATATWWEKYNDVAVPVGWTLLFEIVYPGNRIVLDYGARDDLVLLGAVEVATGRSIGPAHLLLRHWPGPRAEVFEYASLADALAAPPRASAEGLVVHLLDSDERVKLKQEDYVALHRIVTGLNERTVWEHLAAGKPLEELIDPIPDEFHEWVRDVAARLFAAVAEIEAHVTQSYAVILAALPAGYSRKDFALLAVPSPYKWALFAKLDGKDYRAGVWDNVRPEAFRGPRVYSEDTA